MLITQKQIEAKARKAGYEDVRDYAMDHDLERCEECRRWGLYGEEIFGDGVDNYCENHRPKTDIAQ